MRYLVAFALGCVLLLNSGCAIIDAELHNRGGYLDVLADNYWFKADSKKMRVLRAYALQVSLARIASVAPKNGSDRQMLAIRIGNATTRAKYLIDCGFKNNPATGNPADGDPCFYFDSLMVDYTTALFDLAMVAFPVEDTKNLITIIAGGITGPVAAVDLLNALVSLAQEAFKYGRVIGAIYRDTVELEVQVWIASASAPQTNVPPQYRVTQTAVTPLQQVYARGNDDMVSWVAQMKALRDSGLEPVPDIRFINELTSLLKYLCGLVVSTTDPTFYTCTGQSVPTAGATPKMVPARQSRLNGAERSFVWRNVPLQPASSIAEKPLAPRAEAAPAKREDEAKAKTSEDVLASIR